MAKKFKNRLLEKYNEIALQISNYDRIDLANFEQQLFIATLKAAFVKCFEFNLHLCKKRNADDSFLYMSFLRGICEDLISLKFLLTLKPEDRNKLLSIYNNYLLTTSIRAQRNYFLSEKLILPSIGPADIEKSVADAEKGMKEFWESLGHNKEKIFPGVEHMAIDAQLKSLYDFLYHATSRTVHFSPNVLLRTGWYNKNGGPVVFSTKNFHNYYSYFTVFYGTVLFVRIAKAFRKELKLPRPFYKLIMSLNLILKDTGETPEIITFEEMNIRRPEVHPYKVINIIANMEKEERDAFYVHLPKLIEEFRKKGAKFNGLVSILTELQKLQ